MLEWIFKLDYMTSNKMHLGDNLQKFLPVKYIMLCNFQFATYLEQEVVFSIVQHTRRDNENLFCETDSFWLSIGSGCMGYLKF